MSYRFVTVTGTWIVGSFLLLVSMATNNPALVSSSPLGV